MRESKIEKYLHDRVEALGGEYRRIGYLGRVNCPDDLIMLYLPKPRHMMVECKRPGEEPTTAQYREHDRLRRAGMEVHYVSTTQEIDAILSIES